MTEAMTTIELMRRTDIRIAVALAALGLCLVEYGTRPDFSGAYMQVAMIVGIALAAGGFVHTLRTARAGAAPGQGMGAGHLICAVIAFAGLSLRPLGFPLSAAFLVFALFKFAGSGQHLRDAFFAAGFGAAAYVVLMQTLGLPLPLGSLVASFYPA